MLNTDIIKNNNKKLIIALFFVMFLFPSLKTSAQATLPFGGFVTFSIPCTCSANLWVWYTPLYLGPLPVTGAMVYSPYATPFKFGYYLVGVPTMLNAGVFVPGVQACWIITPVGCVPLPSYGLMTTVGSNI